MSMTLEQAKSELMQIYGMLSPDKQRAIDTLVNNSQEPKEGYWIPTYGNVMCSVCGNVKDSRNVGKATHYCEQCGCKMVEPQEGE